MPEVSDVLVVLGQNSDCNKQISDALSQYDVKYCVNNMSRRDNNLISLVNAFESILKSGKKNEAALVVECDCFFEESAIREMMSNLKSNEVRFSNIGLSSYNQKGGFVFVRDQLAIEGFAPVAELVIQNSHPIASAGTSIYKMFGMTAFGSESIDTFLSLFNLSPKTSIKRYFHYLIMEHMTAFTCTTISLSGNTFSFNTVEELADGFSHE